MARRATRTPNVSLFPFLSVLACVIGTLTLLIAAVAVGQVANDWAEAVAPDDEALAAWAREEARGLESRLRAAERTEQELASLEAELRALGAPRDRSARRQWVSDRLRLADTQVEVARLQERLRRQEAAVAVARAEGEASRARGPRRITIQPRGESRGLTPHFVECTSRGLRLLSADGTASRVLQLSDVVDAARYNRFLEQVGRAPGATVIFLLRPEGVRTYQRAVARARELRVRHGKLPLPGDGEVNFGRL
ncbi:MAG: hypothetical protein MJE66_16025 [Proteobacteria bacterium]|nr:hypothetical protein [Pseudomonadota bacterium]